MSSTETSAVALVRRPGSWRWPLIVVGMLVCHVGLMVSVAVIAVRDKSFAVVPDYYKRALDWDKTKAAKLNGQALGWKVTIEPDSRMTPLGERAVVLSLTDSHGRPVDGAELKLGFYHHSHASEARTITLTETSSGKFATTLPLRYAGFYQFDLSIVAGGHTFADSVTQYVESGDLE